MSKGPIYGVELIDSLPLNPVVSEPGGLNQAMPSGSDLYVIHKDHTRVVAGYEVLLAHYRRLREAVDEHLHRRTCRECGNEAWHRDNVSPYVECAKCGSMDTRPKKEH